MPIVRATRSCVLTVNGVPTAVRENDPYDTRDQIVREHRWAFTADVEQATAAPGERRNVRRP